MYTLGSKTVTILQKGFYGDNLYEEFETGSAVKEGQLLALATDGTVNPISNTTTNNAIIGVAMSTAGSGANVTVAMRGFGTIIAEGSASMNAGPVKYSSFTTGTGLNRVANTSSNTAAFVAASSGGSSTTAATLQDPLFIGWALEATTAAGDVCRVVIKN